MFDVFRQRKENAKERTEERTWCLTWQNEVKILKNDSVNDKIVQKKERDLNKPFK